MNKQKCTNSIKEEIIMLAKIKACHGSRNERSYGKADSGRTAAVDVSGNDVQKMIPFLAVVALLTILCYDRIQYVPAGQLMFF